MNRKKENSIYIKHAAIAIITAVFLGVSAFLCGCSERKQSDLTPIPSRQAAMQTTFPNKTPASSHVPESEQPAASLESPSVSYEEKVLKINDRENHIFILTVDLTAPDVSVVPYLAFDRIFGFEYLQSMAEATGAIAAVNAGFFFEYGRPSGLVVSNGEIISSGSGKFYSLVIEDKKPRFEVVKTSVALIINDIEIQIQTYNKSTGGTGSAAFSNAYGATDRLGYFRRVLVIKDGLITESKKTEAPAEIPENGYVVTLPADFVFETDPTGNAAAIEFDPSPSKDAMAYECASMLVENGISLAGDSMPWVGNLNHYDPRTCVGIMKDGRLGFIVIDGRQENYSSGTTGRETADLLLDLGFTDAVMLDGGGSSQMIFDGKTVNSPSSGPEGRPVAGGFMIIKN